LFSVGSKLFFWNLKGEDRDFPSSKPSLTGLSISMDVGSEELSNPVYWYSETDSIA